MLPGKRWLQKLAKLYQIDGRRQLRLQACFQATLAGSFGAIEVTGFDLNRNGAGVQSTAALPLGSLVFLRITSLGVMGFALVRHCSPLKQGYRLGLQFRDPLTRERTDDGSGIVQRFVQATNPAWSEAEF